MAGPLNEISLLFKKAADSDTYIRNLIKTLHGEIDSFQIKDSNKEKKIDEFIKGWDNGDGKTYRSLDIECSILVAGQRKFRLFTTELHRSVIICNFWFYGTKITKLNNLDDGIHDEEKPEFRKLIDKLILTFNPAAATIGYEVDCQELFKSDNIYPHDDYTFVNMMKEQELKEIANSTGFEYIYLKNNGKSNIIIDRIL